MTLTKKIHTKNSPQKWLVKMVGYLGRTVFDAKFFIVSPEREDNKYSKRSTLLRNKLVFYCLQETERPRNHNKKFKCEHYQ
jgi:hypothetical protein